VTLLGSGSGTFLTPSTYTFAGSNEWVYENVVVGDLNNDGLTDVIVAGQTTARFFILTNTGSSPLFSPSYVSFPSGVSSCKAGQIVDLNNDGLPDFVVSCTNGVVVALASSLGSFSAVTVYGSVGKGGLDAADVNQDGFVDIITAGEASSNNLYVFLNDQTGKLSTQSSVSGSIGLGNTVYLADVNGDGYADGITFGNNTLGVWRGGAGGTFSAPTYYLTTTYGGFGMGDINQDGRVDFVVPSPYNGLLTHLSRGCAP
jgi:hypothetical protein